MPRGAEIGTSSFMFESFSEKKEVRRRRPGFCFRWTKLERRVGRFGTANDENAMSDLEYFGMVLI